MNGEGAVARFWTGVSVEPGRHDKGQGHEPAFIALARRLSQRAGLAVFTGLLLTWLAPFGTGRVDLYARTGFWVVLFVAWTVLAFVIGALVDRLLAPRQFARGRDALKFLASLGPMMIVVGYVANRLMGWQPHARELVELLIQVVLLCGLFEIFSRAIETDHSGEKIGQEPAGYATRSPASALTLVSSGAGGAGPSHTSRLADRLPFHMRGPILCLQMEDHYVRIHTLKGSCLVLMRLTDAIAELDGAVGLRAHRSWWVSLAACRAVQRSPRATQICLEGGLNVPVSRPYLEAVLGLNLPTGLRAVAA